MDDNKKILQSGGTTEPKIESASNANYLDDLYSSAGIKPFTSSDNSAYTKFTEKGTNLQNYNFPDINEKNPLSSYTEYGVNVGAGKNYNLQRAQNQTWKDNALNVAAGFIPKVAFGTVGLAGHLGGLLFDQDGDYENALTSWAKESEEYFTSDNKNYAENPNASFFSGEYWSDAANVFDAIDGVVTSAATFALPGIGVASATGRIAAGISKALSASAKATQKGMAMATGASSLTMGYAEAAMSGADIYKEQLEKNLAKGMQYDDAKRIATGAAKTTVRMATIFNTALNIPILGSFTQKTDDVLRKEVGDIVDDLNLRTVDNKGNVIDAVTGKPIDQVKLADQAKDLGGVKQMPDAIKNLPKINEVKDLKAATERLKNIELKPSTWRDVAKVYGKEAGLEFLEEGQIALAEEAGRKYTDPNNTGQNFIKSLKDAFSGIGKEQFWESAALGALGGVGMKALFDIAPVNREISEVDPNITFDAATQTYRTPEGKEVQDNLKRNADGTLIKKRMRASSHDNERKKAMIASEVAYMVEDLSTTQYWQEKMQTIADDYKNKREVVDETLEDGTIKPRVMTKGEAAIKLQEAKAQLFNISARRSIMSGKGDNFKLVFQNIANTDNDDDSILNAKIDAELKELGTAKSKYEDVIADTNSTPEQKEQAKQELENIGNKAKELNARKGLSSAQLQGFSSGANDNEYKKDALEAIAKIDVYTKEYNQLKDTYDYGTAESRQALGKLLENRMKRHTYEYALKDRAEKFANLFKNSTDVTDEDKNNYIARFKDLTHNAKLEIYHLRKKLEAIADEEYLNGGTQTATEFLKELNEYRANQINNDLQEIKNDPAKLAKYEKHRENHIESLEKTKTEIEKDKESIAKDLIIAEQQVQTQTGDEKTKIEASIEKAKNEIKAFDDALVSLNLEIQQYQDLDNFIFAALQGQKEKEYKSKFVEKKLKALENKQKQYEESENRVNAIIEKLKNTKKEDIVEFNNLKNQLLNELKNSKFGFVTLVDLGLDPKQINGDSYERLAELISYQQMDFSLALAEALKSPEHEKLNIETLLKLEELDKDFKEMTSRGGHDKLVANAYELHKRQTKLFLDYQNESKSINENGGANISTPVSSTPATNTQPTQTPERKNKYGITESKYLEYVNLETIKQSYEQGIDSANKTIQEAEENIKNANGNKKLIIQNEQFIANTKNNIDTYKSQLSEINKQIKAILKNSPFETINAKAEELKNEVTSNRDKDIADSKNNIPQNPDKEEDYQHIWNKLFAAYDTYLKAIERYKKASLQNISVFDSATKDSNEFEIRQVLDSAKNEFEIAKQTSKNSFFAIDRKYMRYENPSLFKDLDLYKQKLDSLIKQLVSLDPNSQTYFRDKAILENEIKLYEELNKASENYKESLFDFIALNISKESLIVAFEDLKNSLKNLHEQSISEITREADYLQEQINIAEANFDKYLEIHDNDKSYTDVQRKVGYDKAIVKLGGLYSKKAKSLKNNSSSEHISDINLEIFNAEQELNEAIEKESLELDFLEKEEANKQKADTLNTKINNQKQILEEFSTKYNDYKTKARVEELKKLLSEISNRLNTTFDTVIAEAQLLTIDKEINIINKLSRKTAILRYLNDNKKKSLFKNLDEVVTFLKELGLDSENVSPLLSGAFENNIGLTITLTYDDESTVRGSYDFVKNEIELNAAYLQNAEQAREVLMHELVHALTRERFQDPKSGIVGKTIAVLDKWLGVLGISTKDDNGNDISTKEKLEQIRDNVLMNNLPINDNLKNIFTRIIDAIDKNGTVDETRLDELYAEAFSNKEFAELLKSQPIEGSYDLRSGKVKVNSSIWQKFLSVILGELAYTITRFVSGKTRQISILNELALILNDNPAFIETPEETSNKLAEEKVLEDKKILESQQQNQEETLPANDIQFPAFPPHPRLDLQQEPIVDTELEQKSTNNTTPEQGNDTTQEKESLLVNDDIDQQIENLEKFYELAEKVEKGFRVFTHANQTRMIDSVTIKEVIMGYDTNLILDNNQVLYFTTYLANRINIAFNNKGEKYFELDGVFYKTNEEFNKVVNKYIELLNDSIEAKKNFYKKRSSKFEIYHTDADKELKNKYEKLYKLARSYYDENISNFKEKLSKAETQPSGEKKHLYFESSGKLTKLISDSYFEIAKEQKEQANKNLQKLKSIKESIPTIDLTDKTFVAAPVKSPNLSNPDKTNIETAEANISGTVEVPKFVPEANATPEEEEEVIIDINELTNLLETTRTILDNALAEIEIANIVKEQEALKRETLIESQKLTDEIKSLDESFEALSFTLPSGQEVIEQVFTEEAKEAIDKIEDNTESMLDDIDKNSNKEIAKVEKEKKKRNSKPITPEQVSPNEVKNQSRTPVPEFGTVKPNSPLIDAGIPAGTLVAIKPNNDGTHSILPAIKNLITSLPQVDNNSNTELLQNVPTSAILTSIEPSDSKAPERKDNAATASKEPVIEKRGVPKNNKALRDDLQKRPDVAQEGKEFAVTKEPNNSRALRSMNADGTLGDIVFDNLTDEQAEAYKDSMTNELKSNSGFYTNERISNATTEVVSDNYSENKGYMPALYGDNVEFEEWYKQAVKVLHETGDANKIDFSNTPVRDNLVNQRRIKNTFQEPGYNMDLVRLLYTNAKQILLDKYNKMNNSDISTDIINNENINIHIEKPLSVLDMGWSKEEENNSFVQVFDSINDFVDNSQFIAIGQGKINALLTNEKTEVIGITTPLVENNSVKVYLQDLNSTIVGNFQNPNRFTHIKIEKQEDGKFKVSLTFLNTDKSFEEAAKNEELFTFDELIDSDDFIAYNSSARLLMNNFVTGLGDKETVVLRTPEEKSNYLAEANLTLSLKEKASNKLSDNKVKSIFAKDSTGKVKFYQRAKGIDDKMIGITENELPKIYEDGRYVFLEIKHGKLLPLKVNPKSLEDFNTKQIESLVLSQLNIANPINIESLNKELNNLIKSNFYIAHKLGDIKIKPHYSVERAKDGKNLKLSFYFTYFKDGKDEKITMVDNRFVSEKDLKSALANNIKSDFNSLIDELNKVYRSSDSKKNFNNRSVIMVTNGLVALGEDVTPYLDVKYDHNDRFGNVSFAYKGNDDFKKPTEVKRTYEDVEVVVDNNTNKTPEKEMEIDKAHANIPAGSVSKGVEQLSKRIITYRSKIKNQERLDSTVNDTYNDIFKGKSNFDLRYPNISKVISDSNITNETTVGTLFYSSRNPFLKSVAPLNSFNEYFTLNESNEKQTNINSLLNELYDLTIRLMEYFPNSEPNANVDENDISKIKEDKVC